MTHKMHIIIVYIALLQITMESLAGSFLTVKSWSRGLMEWILKMIIFQKKKYVKWNEFYVKRKIILSKTSGTKLCACNKLFLLNLDLGKHFKIPTVKRITRKGQKGTQNRQSVKGNQVRQSVTQTAKNEFRKCK